MATRRKSTFFKRGWNKILNEILVGWVLKNQKAHFMLSFFYEILVIKYVVIYSSVVLVLTSENSDLIMECIRHAYETTIKIESEDR